MLAGSFFAIAGLISLALYCRQKRNKGTVDSFIEKHEEEEAKEDAGNTNK